MSFISTLALVIALLLSFFGVNLPQNAPDAATPAVQETMAPAVTQAPEATELPTDAPAAPTMQPPVATQVAQVVVSEAEALDDAQNLATAMFATIMSDGEYRSPSFVEDNADTHLAARWVGFKRDAIANAGTHLTAFKANGITKALRAMYSQDDRLVYEIDCVIDADTSSDEDFSQAITYIMSYATDENGNRRIVGLDIDGDADYDSLKTGLPADADVAAIDAYVDGLTAVG